MNQLIWHRRAPHRKTRFPSGQPAQSHRCQPTTHQSTAQQVPRSSHSTANRSHRAAELCGDLIMGQSLPVTAQDHVAILRRQSPNLLLNENVRFESAGLLIIRGTKHRNHPESRTMLNHSAPSRIGSCTGRDAARHAIKPARGRVMAPDRAPAPEEHQKGRLKRVLGVIRVSQQVPAHAQHHRTMAK